MFLLSVPFGAIVVLLSVLFVLYRRGIRVSEMLLEGVKFCIPPTQADAAHLEESKKKKGKRKPQELQIRRLAIVPGTLLNFIYFYEYDNVVFSVVLGGLFFLFSEVYAAFMNGRPWLDLCQYLLLVLCGPCLWSYATSIYASVWSKEAKVSAFAAVAGFLVASALLLLWPDGAGVDADFEAAARSINAQLDLFFRSRNLAPASGSAMELVSPEVLRLSCSLMAALFSGLCWHGYMRYSRLYAEASLHDWWQAKRENRKRAFWSLSRWSVMLRQLDYCSPAFVAVLWFNPFGKNSFQASWDMREDEFERLRWNLTLAAVCLRLWMFRSYIQAHFDSALTMTALLTSSGQPIEHHAPTIEYVNRAVCGVAVQLLVPTVVQLMILLVFKRKADINLGVVDALLNMSGLSSLITEPTEDGTSDSATDKGPVDVIFFTQPVARALLGFSLFWISFSTIVMQLIALVVHFARYGTEIMSATAAVR
eukprot:Rmarinus@m.12126